MYMYTSKGYKFVEYDEPGPPPQPRCKACGAFMSFDPTGSSPVYHVVVDDVLYVDARTGEKFYDQGLRALTEEELAAGKKADWKEGGEPYWDCSHCGASHDDSEAYPD